MSLIADNTIPTFAEAAVLAPRELADQGQQVISPPEPQGQGHDGSALVAPEPTQNAIDVNLLRISDARQPAAMRSRTSTRSLNGQLALPEVVTPRRQLPVQRRPAVKQSARPRVGEGFGTPQERSLDGLTDASVGADVQAVSLDDGTMEMQQRQPQSPSLTRKAGTVTAAAAERFPWRRFRSIQRYFVCSH
jgi:hypothetical protein